MVIVSLGFWDPAGNLHPQEMLKYPHETIGQRSFPACKHVSCEHSRYFRSKLCRKHQDENHYAQVNPQEIVFYI